MKFDSLKNYVDSVTTAVNQHASLLNKLKTEVNLRVAEKSLSETINKFANCITIKDLDPDFMITAVNDNGSSKEEEGSLQSSITNFCSKLEIFGSGFSKVNKIGQTVNGKMQEIENNFAKKVNNSDVKQKVKKVKMKLRGEMENNDKKLEEKMRAMEKRYQEKYELLERRMNRIEQEKGFGTGDIEEIIKRIDLSAIEERITKEMNRVILQSDEVKQNELIKLSCKIQAIEENTNKEILLAKKSANEIASNLVKNKSEDFENEILRHLKSFGGPIEESCSQLKQQVETIKVSIKNLEKIENFKTSSLEVKRLKEVEEALSKKSFEMDELKEKMSELSNTIKEKVEYSELDLQFRVKTEKTEHLDLTDIMQAEEEKYKKINKTIEDLEQKIDKVNQNFDRKTAKLKKEFDIDSLIKQFKNKADEATVYKNFESVESKIAGLSENLVLLKREIDSIIVRNNHSSRQNDNAFISIKSALPKACLSCGNGAPIHQTNNSFATKKHERPQLREKDSSIDRPNTATTLKMKLFSGATILPNATSTQGFGLNPLKISVARQDSLK